MWAEINAADINNQVEVTVSVWQETKDLITSQTGDKAKALVDSKRASEVIKNEVTGFIEDWKDPKIELGLLQSELWGKSAVPKGSIQLASNNPIDNQPSVSENWPSMVWKIPLYELMDLKWRWTKLQKNAEELLVKYLGDHDNWLISSLDDIYNGLRTLEEKSDDKKISRKIKSVYTALGSIRADLLVEMGKINAETVEIVENKWKAPMN